MLRKTSRLLGYLAPIALVALSATQVFAQKQTVVSSVNAPLTLSLTAGSNIVTACENGGAPHVKLTANAVSPSGNPIKYRWTTSAGTIVGEGPVVEWNLAGLKPGYHKASLDIQSVGGDGSCQAAPDCERCLPFRASAVHAPRSAVTASARAIEWRFFIRASDTGRGVSGACALVNGL